MGKNSYNHIFTFIDCAKLEKWKRLRKSWQNIEIFFILWTNFHANKMNLSKIISIFMIICSFMLDCKPVLVLISIEVIKIYLIISECRHSFYFIFTMNYLICIQNWWQKLWSNIKWWILLSIFTWHWYWYCVYFHGRVKH